MGRELHTMPKTSLFALIGFMFNGAAVLMFNFNLVPNNWIPNVCVVIGSVFILAAIIKGIQEKMKNKV